MNQFLRMRSLVLGVFLILAALPAWSEDSAAPSFNGGLTAGLGSETLDGQAYQTLSLIPDFGYGPLGVGLDLTVHFLMFDEPGGNFGFYPRAKDWWDSDLTVNQNVGLYLAKIAYVRWGHKGDPLFVMAGLLPSTTLGTGFLVGGYSNGGLRPDVKETGLEVDLDGSLFGFSAAGAETFVGDLASPTVLGARAYVRPAALTGAGGSLKDLQVGFTTAVDTNVYAQTASGGSGSVAVYGADVIYPFFNADLATARATTDLAFQGVHLGASAGVDGSLLKIFSWGLAARYLGENFLPSYFDRGYEANRVQKYLVYSGDVTVPSTVGWQAQLGTSILSNTLTFGATLSGPFVVQNEVWAQPRLESYATLKNDALPVGLDAYYVKGGITNLAKLVSPENALIGAKVGYQLGAVTLSLVYDLRYLTAEEQASTGEKWLTTSRIETAVKMF